MICETRHDVDTDRGPVYPRPVKYSDLTEADFIESPIVIDEILRSGEIGNLISGTKVGKTWLALSMALAVASGRRWLDRFDVQQGGVLILDTELHRQTLFRRIRTIANALMIPDREFAENLEPLPIRGTGITVNQFRAMLDGCEGAYQLIIVDSLYKAWPAGISENDNAGVAGVYAELDRLAETLGSAIVTVHHSTKGSQSDRNVTDVGAGAGAISRSVDNHVILRPHTDNDAAVMEGAPRSFPPLEPSVLRWNYPTWTIDENADPSALKQTPTRGDARQDSKDHQGRQSIIATLAAHGELSGRKLRAHAGIKSKDRADRLCAQLIDAGEIKERPETIRGNLTVLYSLSQTGVVD